MPEKTVTYNVTIFSAAEMKKAKNKRVSKNKFFKLKSTAEWDTLKAQILVQIENVLKPKQIDYKDYNVEFTVPRHSPHALPLSNGDEYLEMRGRAMKANDPIANLVVTPSESDKVSLLHVYGMRSYLYVQENHSDSDDDETKRKKGKKMVCLTIYLNNLIY
jgi:hypothetical protein